MLTLAGAPTTARNGKVTTRFKRQFTKKFGPWAIVTGASSGIGQEFARQLAANGLNLALVARRKSRLDDIGRDLSETYGVQTRSITVDLTTPTYLEDIIKQTKDLDVGLLVSNAGAGAMGAFLKVPVSDLQKMIHLNVLAQMELAHHFGSRILATRGGGGVLLVSSMVGLQGVPFAADYSGSKAYVLNLGEALHYETRHTGLHVSVVTPGPTSTPGLHDRDDIDFGKLPMKPMSVTPVVRGSLNALWRNQAVYVPGLMNRMLAGWLGRRLMSRAGNVSLWGGLMSRMAPQELKVLPNPDGHEELARSGPSSPLLPSSLAS